jgi:hypothetical protein
MMHIAYNLPEEFKTPAQKELLSLTFDNSLKQRFKLSTHEEFWLTNLHSNLLFCHPCP